jgi:hypothetical protein
MANTYRDRLTIAMLREYYIDKKMTATEVHKLLVAEKNIDVPVNIISYYGNKLRVSDATGVNWPE